VQHEIQSIEILKDSEDAKSKVYLHHDIIIPAYQQCCVECCNNWNRQDISNGDTTLLTQQGLLIAHSMTDSST
jgi:hypothetical protein